MSNKSDNICTVHVLIHSLTVRTNDQTAASPTKIGVGDDRAAFATFNESERNRKYGGTYVKLDLCVHTTHCTHISEFMQNSERNHLLSTSRIQSVRNTFFPRFIHRQAKKQID